jgi:hypothetical protein
MNEQFCSPVPTLPAEHDSGRGQVPAHEAGRPARTQQRLQRLWVPNSVTWRTAPVGLLTSWLPSVRSQCLPNLG